MVSILGWLKGEDLKAEALAFELQQRVTELEQKAMSPEQVRAELLGDQVGLLGNTVTLETALQVPVVLACARVIAEGLAQVPCKLIRSTATGGKQDATDHPLYNLLYRRPNDHQTSFEFREQIGLSLALTFNAFIFVTRDSNGRPLELLPYAPQQVTVVQKGYNKRYFIQVNGKKQEIPAQNMWHIVGPSLDGWQGMDAIKLAREAIGLSQATVTFGSSFFKNGAKPSGILTTDKDLTAQQLQALRDSWALTHSGAANSSKTAMLANGLRYEPMSVAPNDAQFLETRKLQIEEICRIYRVLPLMVQHQEKALSYNSIESLMLMHLMNTLSPWFERFEQSAEVNLLTDKELADGYTIKLNTRGLLKGSAQERAMYYSTMRASGLMTINECRDLEDFDRSSDPLADKLTPAANLFGQAPTNSPANSTGDSNNSGDNNQ